MAKTYPICNCGKAMISTMAFRGKEWWCWNCDHTEEFFCIVPRREISKEDLKELEEKTEESADYRGAVGCISGGGMRKINGKIISFNEFPEELKEKLTKDAKSWRFNNACPKI